MVEKFEVISPQGEKAKLEVKLGSPDELNELEKLYGAKFETPPIVIDYKTDKEEVKKMMEESKEFVEVVAKGKNNIKFIYRTKKKHISFFNFQMLAALRNYNVQKLNS